MGVVHDWLGREVDGYRLIRFLGRGRSADVYLGEHLFLGMRSALKIYHRRVAADASAVFSQGVRAVAQVIHPNIVRVLGGGLVGGHPFLVMDYAPDGSLRERCPRGRRLPPGEVVPYLRQCASALDFSHNQAGVHRHRPLVHCDVKPENILFGPDGVLWLTDFDLAVNVRELGRVMTQETDGDVTYMAPEHLQALVGPACDQYALGVVAYELLCGYPPFQGGRAEVMKQQMSAPPPPFPETVPAAVAAVVMRALEKEAKDRYPTVGAFAAAFEEAVGLARAE